MGLAQKSQERKLEGEKRQGEQSERGCAEARAVRAGVDYRGHPTLRPEVQRPRPGCQD